MTDKGKQKPVQKTSKTKLREKSGEQSQRGMHHKGFERQVGVLQGNGGGSDRQRGSAV